ncbi:TPA: hypothetical protein DIC21_04885 [Candidatus Uhrbacteria bacterium]|nr:hypothetical protein [Candidatus Uhrbacteria bacterium]
MSEVFPNLPESQPTPSRVREVKKHPQKTTDTAGRPLLSKEFSGLMSGFQAEADLNRRAELSAAMASAEKSAEKSVERRARLSQTAAEIAREQSTLAKPKELSVQDFTRRLENLRANRKQLSFFDFSGKRSIDKQITRTEEQLAKAKENRRSTTGKIVAEKLKEFAPIRELPAEAMVEVSNSEANLAVKQLELNSLSALNVFNWSARSRLQEEINVLKKKIAREKIAAVLKGK